MPSIQTMRFPLALGSMTDATLNWMICFPCSTPWPLIPRCPRPCGAEFKVFSMYRLHGCHIDKQAILRMESLPSYSHLQCAQLLKRCWIWNTHKQTHTYIHTYIQSLLLIGGTGDWAFYLFYSCRSFLSLGELCSCDWIVAHAYVCDAEQYYNCRGDFREQVK